MSNSNVVHVLRVDSYFGGCPRCGKFNGYVNAGATHVFFCDAHRVSWIAGANLFSDWRDETEEEQRRKYKHVENFERVEPLGPGLHRASEGAGQ